MIEARNLRREFTQGEDRVVALNDISLTVPAGEFVALMGESGAGKSTLLQILGCLDTPTSGSYRLNGQDVATFDEQQMAAIRNRTIGFIFQTSHFVDYLSLVENIALPGFYRNGALKSHHRRSEELLRQVGLGHRLKHLPAALSGGERQRAAIARALFNEPSLILADEPTGNLDRANTDQIVDLLQQLHRHGITLVMVTHDQRVAEAADRTVALLANTGSGDDRAG